MQENDKRKFSRIRLDIAIQLHRCDDKEAESLEAANAVNISPEGVCIQTGSMLEKDDLVQINLPRLGGGSEPVIARVVYNQPQPPQTGYFSGLIVLPQYREKLSDYIENLDKGNDLGVYLSPEDRAFLESLAGGPDKIPSSIIGISRFFRDLDMKVSGKISSEQDLVTYLKNELRKRSKREPESGL